VGWEREGVGERETAGRVGKMPPSLPCRRSFTPRVDDTPPPSLSGRKVAGGYRIYTFLCPRSMTAAAPGCTTGVSELSPTAS